jgi:pimeloyl-ACP methyl ester carboxylesterase
MPTAPNPNEYLDQGEGPTVVLLHSSLGSKSQWRALCAELATTHRTLAIDLYGYGAAPMPACADSGFALADEVLRIEQMLAGLLERDEHMHLVGHSYGGAVALRLALRLGARVRSISVYEPTAFHTVPKGDAALDAVRSVAGAVHQWRAAPSALQLAEHFIDFWSGPGSFTGLPQARQEALSRQLPKVALDFQALFDASLSASDYRAVGAPVCLIGGVESPGCTRAILGALAGALPRRTIRTVDAGHMGPVTRPQLVNPLIADFILRLR